MRGYGAAGGRDKDGNVTQRGTIFFQDKAFREAGWDWKTIIPKGPMLATLNIDTGQYKYECRKPTKTLPNFDWLAGWTQNGTPLSCKEDFIFTEIKLHYKQKKYDAALYHIDNKADCFHKPTVWEIVAEPIQGIAYGDNIAIAVDPAKINLVNVSDLANVEEVERKAA